MTPPETEPDDPRIRRSAEGDPLTLFLEPRRRTATGARVPARPFESGEHIWIGSAGAELACRELRTAGKVFDRTIFQSIKRRRTDDRLSYGELVALSGDFYGSPSALYDEAPARLPWLWEDNDLSDLREIFEEELAWIEARQSGRGAEKYPDNNLRMAWNAKSYIELALDNTAHFGWHNALEYARHHEAALDLARQAEGRENDTWRRALFTNAFADHFLTDGFAAGHVRVPRAEIRVWGEGRGYSEKVAGALSKLLHDQDGHVSSFHSAGESGRDQADGLRVTNAAGASWFTFCDGQLFLPPGAAQSPAVETPVRAVAQSVKELLLAWREGRDPAGPFAATSHVPFPHPDAPSLTEKFPRAMPTARFDALLGSVNWYSKIPWIGPGLTAGHVRALLENLPDLMERFRQRVAADRAANPGIVKRIDAGYLDGFARVN
jgi:hypothetical protein